MSTPSWAGAAVPEQHRPVLLLRPRKLAGIGGLRGRCLREGCGVHQENRQGQARKPRENGTYRASGGFRSCSSFCGLLKAVGRLAKGHGFSRAARELPNVLQKCWRAALRRGWKPRPDGARRIVFQQAVRDDLGLCLVHIGSNQLAAPECAATWTTFSHLRIPSGSGQRLEAGTRVRAGGSRNFRAAHRPKAWRDHGRSSIGDTSLPPTPQHLPRGIPNTRG